MVNRRQFIGSGTAASVAAALAGASIASARDIPDSSCLAVHAAVFDERFAAARRFGAAMQRRGLRVHAIRGDVTQVWYSHLHPQWKRAQSPVAGVTAYAAMFCLERLAWDHGLRMRRLPVPEQPGRADALEVPLYSWIIGPRSRA